MNILLAFLVFAGYSIVSGMLITVVLDRMTEVGGLFTYICLFLVPLTIGLFFLEYQLLK